MNPNIRKKALDVFQNMDTEDLVKLLDVSPKQLLPKYQTEQFAEALTVERYNQEFNLDDDESRDKVERSLNHSGIARAMSKYTVGYSPKGEKVGDSSGAMSKNPRPDVTGGRTPPLHLKKPDLRVSVKRPARDNDEHNNGIDEISGVGGVGGDDY